MSMKCLSFPLLSLHRLYMTLASTLAAEEVLGSLSNEITLSRMVLMGEGRKGWESGAVRGGVDGEMCEVGEE